MTLVGDTQPLGYKSSLSPKIKQLEQEQDQRGQKVTLRLPRPAPGTIFLLGSSSHSGPDASLTPDWLFSANGSPDLNSGRLLSWNRVVGGDGKPKRPSRQVDAVWLLPQLLVSPLCVQIPQETPPPEITFIFIETQNQDRSSFNA